MNLVTGAAGQAQAGSLDSIRVKVAGPTNKTMDFACSASTCSGTVDGLDPGSYSVVVAGIVGGAVDHYGTVSSVAVTAGQTSQATVSNWTSFRPVLTIAADTVDVLDFPVTFTKVSTATSYVLEWSKAQDFTGAQSQTLTDTSATITVADSGQYYVRVRAVNADVGSGGRASAPEAIFAFQGVATVSVVPATATIAAGATQQFTAYGLDANSDTVPNVTYYWASSNPSIATVDQNGLATGVAGAGGAVTISAVGKGQPGSATLTVGAQTPTKLTFSVQPTNTVAGAAVSPAVQIEIRDANNNLVTTARNAVTIAFGNNAGSGTLSGTQVVNAINGIASFTGLWIDKAATGYTLTAGSGSLTGATSSAFNVTPGAPAQLSFAAQPTDAHGNVVIAPAVTVTVNDLYNNQTTASNQVTVGIKNNPWATVFSAGGSLFGTLTVAANSGVATFNDLRVDNPGAGYTLAAASGALTAGTSAGFNVNLAIQQIAGGQDHTCALTANGAYCWGAGYDGELGYPVGFTGNNPVPGLVAGGLTFTQVSAGGSHSCGIAAGGAAYCWGANYNGQLGDGTNTGQTQPVAVNGSHVFASISAGGSFTCGVTTTSGTAAENQQVYCWGYGGNGQLGNNSTVSSNVPVRVAEPLQTTAHAVAVSAGANHVCARTATAFYCWGYNGYGELGNATNTNSSTPVAVSGLTAFTGSTIGAGAYHSCAVDANSHVSCWGLNNYGELGNGTTTNSNVPVSSGTLMFSSVTAGYYHSCGVLTNGTGYCWGNNNEGELGDGGLSGTQSSVPVQVNTSVTFTSMSAGGFHTCGRVGTTVYCWGQNYDGEMGSGSTSNTAQKSPQAIIQ